MHDPKFEKEVQQKMAELEFSPSESVWANVEKAMNSRRRRGMFYFWRLALPALLLLAGGGYYYFTRTEGHSATPDMTATTTAASAKDPAPVSSAAGSNPAPSAKAPVNAAASTPAPTPASAPTSAATSAPVSTPALASTPASTPASASPTASAPTSTPALTSAGKTTPSHNPDTYPASTDNSNKGTTISSTLTAAGTGTHRTHSRNPFAASVNRHPNRVITQTGSKPAEPEDRFAATATGRPSSSATTDKPVAETALPPAGIPPAAASPAAGNDPVMAYDGVSKTHPVYSTLANQRSSAAIHTGKLASQNAAVAIKAIQSPRRPWEAAFVGGGGISSLHQVQLSNYSLRQYDPATAAYSNTGITTNAAQPTKQYISTVRPGASFWAGIQAQKALSARWGFSLGLNLHYYSNRVHIGQQVSSYTPAAASLLTSSAVAPIQSYPYYSAGNDQAYTNRYYFLELPVAIEWKINNSKLLPLFLDGGVSVGYLMGSSAVYYNTHSGVYYKDGGVANKTQVNLSTALMVGLPIRGLRVQVGPQIQYGLTSLLNIEQTGEQHIFYGGIRFVVFPGKK